MMMKFRRLGVLVPASTLLLALGCGTASQSRASSNGSGSGDDAVVARVGEREITMAELDEKVSSTNMEVLQALYNARREALGELVAGALLEKEAERRGLSVDELVQKEIASKVSPVSDEDVETFFNQNRARLGGQSLEQIGEQIRQYLNARNEAAVRQSYLDGLRKEVNVTIALDPPRVPIRIAQGERVSGPDDAPVTIVEYSDFQ